METSNYTVTVLRAAEGHKLVKGDSADAAAILIADTVYLGVGDSAESYREVPDAEAAGLAAARDAAIAAATAARIAALTAPEPDTERETE